MRLTTGHPIFSPISLCISRAVMSKIVSVYWSDPVMSTLVFVASSDYSITWLRHVDSVTDSKSRKKEYSQSRRSVMQNVFSLEIRNTCI